MITELEYEVFCAKQKSLAGLERGTYLLLLQQGVAETVVLTEALLGCVTDVREALMGTVQCGSNATAAPNPADTDTRPLGGSEVLPCVIPCPTSELVSQVASAQVCLGSLR